MYKDSDCFIIEVPFAPAQVCDSMGNNCRKELKSTPPVELGIPIVSNGMLHAYPLELEEKAKELGYTVSYRNRSRFYSASKLKMPTSLLERK